MSLDFPNRDDWLARRATPAKVVTGTPLFNPAVQSTYSPGRNKLKRYVGIGKQRRKARKAMQREARAKEAENANRP